MGDFVFKHGKSAFNMLQEAVTQAVEGKLVYITVSGSGYAAMSWAITYSEYWWRRVCCDK